MPDLDLDAIEAALTPRPGREPGWDTEDAERWLCELIALCRAQRVELERAERRVAELDAEAQREAMVADQILERAERAERVETAAREMLRFGEHEGPCTNHDDASGTESCELHAEAFERRQAALRAALAALDEEAARALPEGTTTPAEES